MFKLKKEIVIPSAVCVCMGFLSCSILIGSYAYMHKSEAENISNLTTLLEKSDENNKKLLEELETKNKSISDYQAAVSDNSETLKVMQEELEKAKKEIRQGDEDSARRHKIAGLFCKAFEKAVLLTPTEENVRIWAECTRMNQDEIRDSAQEARELAEVFTAIANILGTMLKDQGGNESIA